MSILCLFVLVLNAHAQSYTPKKQKGKWGLVDYSKNPVTDFIYDSITSKEFEQKSIDESISTTLKELKQSKSFYYLWINGSFDVFDHDLLIARVTDFAVGSHYSNNKVYIFQYNNLWGWGYQGGKIGDFRSDALYDSIRFLQCDQLLFDQEAYTRNNNKFDLTGYSYYASYFITSLQAYKEGCLNLINIDLPKYTPKKYCQAAYFISIPEKFMVTKNASGTLKYIADYDSLSPVAYDSVACIYGMWIGFNKETGKADLHINNEKKTIVFANVLDWIAERDQFRNDIALAETERLKQEIAANEKEKEKQKQLSVVKAKELEEQEKTRLESSKADARKRLAKMKDLQLTVFTWKTNDSLLGVRTNNGEALIYPAAKKIVLMGSSNFKPAIFTASGDRDIDVSGGFNNYHTKDSVKVMPDALAGKLLSYIDTCTSTQRIPYTALQADVRIYDATGKKHFIYTRTITTGMNPESFEIYTSVCPVCNGAGYLMEGDSSIKTITQTEKKLQKTGTVSTTKKNYLANERVVNGRLEAPTYSQSYDKFEYVDVVTSKEVVNSKQVRCYGCNGSKKGSLSVSWDVLRQKYICKIH